ncbi:MAG: helix-hairpin-helix domain-containing protein [bacterium]|nr:helix-hairpin-helix domain-containing protein [bacterium]
MRQNLTKIIVGCGVILILFLLAFFKLDTKTFVFLGNLINGSYKEQLAKISGLNSSQSGEEITRATTTAPIKKCAYETKLSPTYKGAIFYEIAWMGDNKGTTNEWITLKIMSSAETNISNWQIINQNGRLKIILPKGKILNSSKPTFTIARHSKIDGIIADLMFAGSIKNSSEALRLFDSDCILIDEVTAKPNWPAGNNTTKKPVVRLPNLKWQTKGGSASFGKTKDKPLTTIAPKATPQVSPFVVTPPKCANINTATDIELQKIIHIGPKLSLQIIQLRSDKQFSSIDDLIKIKGIGSSTLADIRKQGIACII